MNLREMGMSRFSLAVLMSFGILGIPKFTRANGSEVGFDAGNIFPIESTAIQLQREEIRVWLAVGAMEGEARCKYVLRNLSPSQQHIEMGFVTTSPYGNLSRSSSIKVWQSNKTIPVTFAPTDPERWRSTLFIPPDSLPTWSLDFGPHEVVELYITYPVSWSGGSDGNDTGIQFAYHARPAALWAGKIEEALIHFRIGGLVTELLRCRREGDPCVDIKILPAGYQLEDEGPVWHFRNWEPSEDVEIKFWWTAGPD